MHLKQPILSSYLLRRWLQFAGAITGLFVTVLLLLYAADVMSQIAGGDLPASLLGWQLLLHVPEAVRTVLPLAAVMAILLVRQQLLQNREWIMFTAGGWRPGDFRRVLLRYTAEMIIVLLLVGAWVQPLAKSVQQALFERAARSAEFWGILPGRFNRLPQDGGVIYVAEIDSQGQASDIFLRLERAHETQVLSAASGNFSLQPDGGRIIRLGAGRRAWKDNRGKMQLLDFEQAVVSLPPVAGEQSRDHPEAWNWRRLLGSSDRLAGLEVQRRLEPGVTVLVLIVWAMCLVRSGRLAVDGSAGWHLFVMVLIFIVYLNLLNVTALWIERGRLPLWPGLWLVHGAMLAAALGWRLLSRRLRL